MDEKTSDIGEGWDGRPLRCVIDLFGAAVQAAAGLKWM
jgi:hypothetical protein